MHHFPLAPVPAGLYFPICITPQPIPVSASPYMAFRLLLFQTDCNQWSYSEITTKKPVV